MSIIYALSSGAGRAGVAVIRLSGPGVAQIVRSLAGALPHARHASLRRLRAANGETIDHGLVLWFPGPHSFTGEDCAEFQVHGSRAVVAALLETLSQFPGCSPAEAGEFARRAFLNGRADLIQLEALADLLVAETEAQRRMALRHADGRLRGRVEGWAARLDGLLAHAEADLDFTDEDDVDVDLSEGRSAAALLADDMRRSLAQATRSDAMREGFVIAIIGPPNAGKSSLLNRLAGHEAAIVSDIPGTTRDTIEIRLDLDGLPVRVIDTAGLRDEAGDPIEMMGVERARAAAARADLTVWLAMHEPPPAGMEVLGIASQRDRFGSEALPDWSAMGVSVADNASIAALLERFRVTAESGLGVGAELAINDRQRRLIESACASCRAAAMIREEELYADELRRARLSLARITGRVAAGDILDVVFSQFCIGK